jgi:hypothetical protein
MDTNRRLACLCSLLLAASSAACGTTSPVGWCDGVDCGEGECRELPFDQGPYCACWPGYHPGGAGDLSCLPNDPSNPCDGVVCSYHGRCVATAAIPVCECDAGYVRDSSGLHCLATEPPPDAAAPDANADGDGDADADADADVPPWWTDEPVRQPGLTKLDLVFLVDNSGSMSQEQEALTQRFPELIRELLVPPDNDGDTRPDHAAVEDLNIGVVSSDMGTGGYAVSTCVNSAVGDDGCMRHTPNPAVAGCGSSYPTFLARNPANAASYTAEMMAVDFTCVATLGTQGCGFEQQLKAMRRALTDQVRPGGCNTGFLREESLLALIFVTDEEDCSVRADHPEMFDQSRSDLGHLNVRCFMHPEFVEPVSDYVESFRTLRPSGAANMFLAFIVGVPPDATQCTGFADRLSGCLAVPAMIEQIDPAMPTQLVPSCNTTMGYAYPPRRFVQLAQAWGKDAYVDSICKTDWTAAFGAIGGRLVESLRDDFFCLDAPRAFDADSCTLGCWLVETYDTDRPCAADPLCPQAWCPAAAADGLRALAPCRDPSSSAECLPLKRDLGLDARGRRQCLVRQAPRDPASSRCSTVLNDGWYYQPVEWSEHSCPELVYARSTVEPLLESGSGAALRCPL